MIVGVVKSLATDGGNVISCCISLQYKCRFRLFTSSSLFLHRNTDSPSPQPNQYLYIDELFKSCSGKCRRRGIYKKLPQAGYPQDIFLRLTMRLDKKFIYRQVQTRYETGKPWPTLILLPTISCFRTQPGSSGWDRISCAATIQIQSPPWKCKKLLHTLFKSFTTVRHQK